jgi:hypothetical protein
MLMCNLNLYSTKITLALHVRLLRCRIIQ